MASSAAPLPDRDGGSGSPPAPRDGIAAVSGAARQPAVQDKILCGHCGRTASNGISCQGICVADSGY
jgi:hypothetical protein